ncbi:MAG: hypothetical protein ACLQAT_13670, partial [Candidatus Binataceae bacterium]
MSTIPNPFDSFRARQRAEARDFLERHPEVRAKLSGDASAQEATEETVPPGSSKQEPQEHPSFPKAAWRGPFAEYREAMAHATEASDVFHFAAFWARGAVALGRTVHFPYGSTIYPNVYIVGFGPTGDRKTTAMRKAWEIGGRIKIIHGAGS